jgi:hypothetical protein
MFMAVELSKLFPAAKFLFTTSPADTTVNTMLATATCLNKTDRSKYVSAWRRVNGRVRAECTAIGTDKCLVVKAKSLRLERTKTLYRVLEFLQVAWTSDVLDPERIVSFNESTVVSDQARGAALIEEIEMVKELSQPSKE